LFAFKKVREASKVKALNARTAEALFILVFGAFHFAIPFILLPSIKTTINLFVTLHIADFVLPGCFTLAIVSIIFYVTSNRYSAALLAFLYSGGIIFHVLYFLGLVPPVIIVPNSIILVAGIVADALSIMAIYDYYRRVHFAFKLLPN
jgi:hypothetical protein